mmetsp:Transcript_75339/g.211248  ORF Transcript_75339/g.211248 Transcript_75339/m.211248 type:complete len:330 (-) Transcript_75339:206-1195(-)
MLLPAVAARRPAFMAAEARHHLARGELQRLLSAGRAQLEAQEHAQRRRAAELRVGHPRGGAPELRDLAGLRRLQHGDGRDRLARGLVHSVVHRLLVEAQLFQAPRPLQRLADACAVEPPHRVGQAPRLLVEVVLLGAHRLARQGDGGQPLLLLGHRPSGGLEQLQRPRLAPLAMCLLCVYRVQSFPQHLADLLRRLLHVRRQALEGGRSCGAVAALLRDEVPCGPRLPLLPLGGCLVDGEHVVHVHVIVDGLLLGLRQPRRRRVPRRLATRRLDDAPARRVRPPGQQPLAEPGRQLRQGPRCAEVQRVGVLLEVLVVLVRRVLCGLLER